LLPLGFSQAFTRAGAEIGVLLLLFMLGLEYTGRQLRDNLRAGLGAGIADLLPSPQACSPTPHALAFDGRSTAGRCDVGLLVVHRCPAADRTRPPR
jgi:hypothetical protein